MPQPSRSPVWRFFDKLGNSGKAKCKFCENEISCGNTSAMINHLKVNGHEKVYSEYEALTKKDKKRPAEAESSTPPPTKQARIDSFTQKLNSNIEHNLDEAIVEFLGETFTAIRIVDHPSFKKMFQVLNDKVKVKGRTYYSNLITQKAQDIRNELHAIIEFLKDQLNTITFTTDLWTSINGDPFMCLTLHFITKDWKLYRFTPYIRPFPQKHTGHNISLSLDQMIEELKLDRSDFLLVSVNDNAANMKLGLQLSRYLEEYNCDIHTLELVIKDAFKNNDKMLDLLKKCQKICNYSHSHLGSRDLREACTKCEIPLKKLVNPPNTRWCGFHATLKSILEMKYPLMKIFEDCDNWSDMVLNPADWKLIESAAYFLNLFRETVLMFEAEATPTMHLVVERIYTLNSILHDFIVRNNNQSYITKFARELSKSLNKRFPNSGSTQKYRSIANYLAPQFKADM